jgi:hypothetical protein
VKLERQSTLIILLMWPLVATLFVLLTHANYLASQVLFWGFPAILLSLWTPHRILKAALVSAIATGFGIACNFIFYLNGQWYVASTVFASRMFGLMAWEDILYFFLFFYAPILFWEHFLEPKRPERVWQSRMRSLSIGFACFMAAVLATWKWLPGALLIPYFYLIVTLLLFVAPVVLSVAMHPKLTPRLLRIGAYFGYVAILFEVTSILLGQWNYPSTQFIGWVELFGARFPFEEFITWILIGAPGVVVWYEYFADDNR